MKYRKNPLEWLFYADLPLLAMGGFALGALLIGAGQVTFGASTFFEPQICDTVELLKGLACLGVSLAIIGVMTLYWLYVLKKQGPLFPEYNGFGLILVPLSMLAGGMICTFLIL